MKKPMRTRTKFTILAACMIFIILPIQVVLSVLGKTQLSDGFCQVWVPAWTVELLITYGLKKHDKTDD